jgi:site-specific DNA-methyltransferase (adenine-specific)
MNKSSVIRGDAFDVTGRWVPGSVDLIVTDPPYGKITKESWDKTWTDACFDRLAALIARLLKPGGTAYVWGGIGAYCNRGFFKWLSRVEEPLPVEDGLGLRSSMLRIHDVITWRKRRAYGKSDAYLFTREECVMLVKEGLPKGKPATFHVPLLAEERGYAGYNVKYPAKSKYLRRTNVWTDVTEIFKGKIHPCEKPSRLAEIMIETSSNPGELVVDLFAGAGGVGVAAEKLGRRYLLIEKSNCKMHSGLE